tara:strand:- start:613 stop:1086 length:474 start_codon:yes stop_codon:yes gene_type:complete
MGTGKMKKMSRQQQKAVGASMNEAASGEGAPNKMIVSPSQQTPSKDLGTQFDEMQMKIENDAKEREQQEMIQNPQVALNQDVNEEENLTIEQKKQKTIDALRERYLQDGSLNTTITRGGFNIYKAKPETRSFNKNDALSLQQGSALVMIKNILKSKK